MGINCELHRTCITYTVFIDIPVLFLVWRKRRPENVYRTQLWASETHPYPKTDVLNV